MSHKWRFLWSAKRWISCLTQSPAPWPPSKGWQKEPRAGAGGGWDFLNLKKSASHPKKRPGCENPSEDGAVTHRSQLSLWHLVEISAQWRVPKLQIFVSIFLMDEGAKISRNSPEMDANTTDTKMRHYRKTDILCP